MSYHAVGRSVDTHGQSRGTLPFESFRKAGDVDKDDSIHSCLSETANQKRIDPQALMDAQRPSQYHRIVIYDSQSVLSNLNWAEKSVRESPSNMLGCFGKPV